MAVASAAKCAPLLPLPSASPRRNRLLASSFVPRNPLPPRFPRGFQRAAPRPPGLSRPVVAAAQSNWVKVIQTAWRVGRDAIEAGTNLVPAVVPKPIARIGVAGVLVTVALFVLKSFVSTAFFVLAMMGLIYFAFLALNTDEASRGGGSTTSTEEETLEEARRIMEKYK